jgi:ParE toxin of type II toxin-antitoxin system, parDE
MIVEFLAEAKSELLDAVAYYEGELNGLGQRLWDEVNEHIEWIVANHEVPRLRPGGYRRVNLRVFPYFVSYIVRDPVIWIVAIAHGHSLPEYWIDRPQTIR